MNGKEILVDTNILLYLLKGSNTLEEILQGKQIFISFITELELIGFKDISESKEKLIKSLLEDCIVFSLNNEVKLQYVAIRKKYNLKLADAIIAASAISMNIPLISADKQFTSVKELNLVTYEP